MKVVEQPLGAGGDELAVMEIIGERPIRFAQCPGVVVKSREDAARPVARVRVDGEVGRERERAPVEALDAEELVAKGGVAARVTAAADS